MLYNTQGDRVIFPFGLPRWLSGKESAFQCRRLAFNSWVGKIPWRRKWQPIPVSLPGKSHRQRSLVGCSPRGRKESGMAERLTLTLTRYQSSDGAWKSEQVALTS